MACRYFSKYRKCSFGLGCSYYHSKDTKNRKTIRRIAPTSVRSSRTQLYRTDQNGVWIDIHDVRQWCQDGKPKEQYESTDLRVWGGEALSKSDCSFRVSTVAIRVELKRRFT